MRKPHPLSDGVSLRASRLHGVDPRILRNRVVVVVRIIVLVRILLGVNVAEPVLVLAERVLVAGPRHIVVARLVVGLTGARVLVGVTAAGVIFAVHGFPFRWGVPPVYTRGQAVSTLYSLTTQ